MCPLQLQVNFNSGSYVTIPTATHFFQWANRTHSNFKVLIIQNFISTDICNLYKNYLLKYMLVNNDYVILYAVDIKVQKKEGLKILFVIYDVIYKNSAVQKVFFYLRFN